MIDGSATAAGSADTATNNEQNATSAVSFAAK